MLKYKVNDFINNNFLNDYIEHRLKKEKKKFSKLNFKTIINNSKKISKIDSQNKEKLPYINKQLFIDINAKDKILTNNLNSTKMQKNTLLNDNLNQNQFSPTKVFSNIKEPLKIKNKDELNNNSNLNKFPESQNENISKDNNEEINDYKIKRKVSIEKINPRMSLIKLSQKLKIELDKELIINDNDEKKKKNIKNIIELKNMGLSEDKNKLKKIKSEIKQKKEKEEETIIDTLYIGNSIINNCKIKNKIIYDIRPLNKTKERASCHFLSEENYTKPINNEKKLPKNNTINSISTKNIKNTNYITQKSLKYFRNAFSQVYSMNETNSNFNNNNGIAINIKINDNKEKDKDDFDRKKNKFKKYELSEQEFINILNSNKEENDKNNNKNNDFNKKKKLSKSKSKNFHDTKRYNNKKNLEFIDLEILTKEISDEKKSKNNLRSFFAKEENVVRGEKIKFLKTCSQVKFVKPLLSQHTYKFKATNSTKKIFSPKRVKFPINHFNLDILRDSNLKEIYSTKKYLCWLKRDINLNLNNLVNNLEKEINYT